MNPQHAKLQWRCRRGMKELDMLLLGYLQHAFDTASEEERRAFAELLELQDPQLMAYVVGRETPTDQTLATLISKLRASARY